MNAQELYLKNGKAAGIYYCGECATVHRILEDAGRCCQPATCNGCGSPLPKGKSQPCKSCWKRSLEAKEQERFANAEKIKPEDYYGWVFCEIGPHEYFESVQGLLDYLADADDEALQAMNRRPYCWTCRETQFGQITEDQVIDLVAESDGAYEDFDPYDIEVPEEMKRGIEAFNEANKGLISYFPDYKRAVVLNPNDWKREGGAA